MGTHQQTLGRVVMGYCYVKSLSWKKSVLRWKLQFISYKNEDCAESKANKPQKEWDIGSDRWPPLGFHKQLSIEDAKVRAKQLNADLYARKQEKQILVKNEQELREQLKQARWLPSEFVAEFEARFVRARDSETIAKRRRKTRAQIIWRAAQRAIREVGADPGEWFYHTYEFYDYFFRAKLSVKYVLVILKMVNPWGLFISRKLNQPFMALSPPRGYERARLIENYYSTPKRCSRASLPITPQQLLGAKETLLVANYNWLLLSVWFGLRPQEIDNLQDKSMWRVEIADCGKAILWVYQTKIVALPPEHRWKPIPIIFQEQTRALEVLESENFRRPLLKTMRQKFGDGVTLYCGRKGFADLMLSRGQKFENISIWMGHSSLGRTWTSYKDKRRFHLNCA
jgi:hypothetical protein